MVHDAGLPGDVLGHGDALVLGLVGQHRAGDHVADRPDAVDLGAEVVVGLDLAALVEFEADRVEAEAVGVGLRPMATSTQSASSVSASPPAAGSSVSVAFLPLTVRR